MTPAKTWPDMLSHGSNMTTVWARSICHVFFLGNFDSPILMATSGLIAYVFFITFLPQKRGPFLNFLLCSSRILTWGAPRQRVEEAPKPAQAAQAAAAATPDQAKMVAPGKETMKMLGWASWFPFFFLRLNMKNVGSTKIFDLFSGYRAKCSVASLHGFPSYGCHTVFFPKRGMPRNFMVKSIIFPIWKLL